MNGYEALGRGVVACVPGGRIVVGVADLALAVAGAAPVVAPESVAATIAPTAIGVRVLQFLLARPLLLGGIGIAAVVGLLALRARRKRRAR